MACAHALLFLLPWSGGSEIIISASTFLGGFSFGSMFPHLVVLTSELFGSANLSTNYMLYDGGRNFVSSLLFVKLLAGSSQQAHTAPDQKDCIGLACFERTHIIVIASNV